MSRKALQPAFLGLIIGMAFSSSFLIHLEDSLRVLLVFQPDSVFTQYVAKYLLKSRLGEQSKITSATSVDEMKALWEGVMFELSLS